MVEPQPAAQPTLPPTAGVSATPDHATELMRKWSVMLPKTLDPWFPQLADALADGAWLAGWKKASTIPYIALAVGFLAPWVWPGIQNIYSESLLFLMLVTAASILSGTWGATILAGYIVGDSLRVMLSLHLVTLLGHVVAYLLLAILVLRIPLLARRLSDLGRRLPSDATLRVAAQAGLRGAICGGLVFLWCQGTIVLIRPVFTWAGGSPTDAAVMQVQVQWPWLVAVAAVAAVVRVVLEDFSASRSTGASLVAGLRASRRASAMAHGAAWQRVSAKARIAFGAAFLTVILAGTYAGWIDPIIVLVVASAVGAWRAGLVGKIPRSWVSLTEKIPAVVRMIIVPLVGFLISNQIVSLFWASGSLRPVMVGALTTVVLFYAMFPNAAARRRTVSA